MNNTTLTLCLGKRLRHLALIVTCMPLVAMYAECASAQAAPFTTYYRYDTERHLVGVIYADPDGAGPIHYAAIRNTYNAQGLVATVEKGELAAWQATNVLPSAWAGFTVFQTQTNSYDTHGRQVKTSMASGATTYSLSQTSYDSQGRVDCTVTRMNPATFANTQPAACTLGTASTFGADRITKTTYDPTTHTITTTRAYGTSLQQDYATTVYANALQVSTQDANGNLTAYVYDGFERLSDENFPSLTTTGQPSSTDYEHYTYDNNGNRLSLRKRDGSVIGYQYDALDRTTFKDIPGGTSDDVYYEYDLRGLQTSAMFGLSSGAGPSTTGITTVFDGFGRVTSSSNNSDTFPRTLSYTYDADGDRLSVAHPDSKTFGYGYDGLDRTQYMCETTLPCLSSSSPMIVIAYDNQGHRKTLTRAGTAATSTGYLYDPVARLQTLNNNLDGTGTGNDVVFGFTYTPSNQIATRNTSIGAFANNSPPASSTSYTPNRLNQYSRIVGTSTVSPTWDLNGNLKFDGSVNYFYDTENRLSYTTGAKTANFDYDPNGRLIQTDTGTAASETHFLYDGDALVAEYNSAGAVLRRFVHGPGIDEPLVWYESSAVGINNRKYYFQNYQGSIVAIADHTGATTQVNTYDAYGVPGGSYVGRFQYTGQIRIPEIGMYFYKARIYDATTGRFLQTDPVGYTTDNNLYTYVGDDPTDKTDPSGNQEAPLEEETKAEEAESSLENINAGGLIQAINEVEPGNSYAIPPGYHFTPEDIQELQDKLDEVQSQRGMRNPRTRDAVRIGQEFHREQAKIDAEAGETPNPRGLTDPATGKNVVPDKLTKTGRPVEYKPNTPSGRSRGAKQLKKYERATGKRGKVVCYDPVSKKIVPCG